MTDRSGKKRNEYVTALFISWCIVSMCFAGVLAASFFPEQATRLSQIIFPDIFNHKETHQCFFCGMTRAFFEISGFNIEDARAYNAHSVKLYLFMCGNVFVLCVLAFRTIVRFFYKYPG